MPKLKPIVPVLNALAVFESAARLLGFTRAAKELGLTQPSVSRHIRKLEVHMGTALFERQHNRLVLTHTGKRLARATGLGFEHVAAVVDELQIRRREADITLACTAGFAHHWLSQRFSKLRKLLGGQRLHVATSEWFEELDPNRIDILIRPNNSHWLNWVSQPLFEETAFPVAAQALLQQFSDYDPLRPVSLLAMPLLHYQVGDTGFLNWQSWFKAQGVDYTAPQNVYHFDNYNFLLQATTEGEGVCLGWPYMVGELIKCQQLTRAGPTTVNAGSSYFIEFAPERFSAERQQVITSWFQNELKTPIE